MTAELRFGAYHAALMLLLQLTFLHGTLGAACAAYAGLLQPPCQLR